LCEFEKASRDPEFSGPSMVNPIEFFQWWIVDERTGERRLTTYKLSRANAERAFPGSEPDPSTREVRNLPDLQYVPSSGRPGKQWE